MGKTIDLGRRIELVPMDPHFHNISIALYRQQTGDGPVFQVHSYSNRKVRCREWSSSPVLWQLWVAEPVLERLASCASLPC
jgi:hypothetical protein